MLRPGAGRQPLPKEPLDVVGVGVGVLASKAHSSHGDAGFEEVESLEQPRLHLRWVAGRHEGMVATGDAVADTTTPAGMSRPASVKR
jgi:hypothetical protein